MSSHGVIWSFSSIFFLVFRLSFVDVDIDTSVLCLSVVCAFTCAIVYVHVQVFVVLS